MLARTQSRGGATAHTGEIARSPSRRASIAGTIGGHARPDLATFAGSGKVEEIAALPIPSARIVIFDHVLSGVQQRDLGGARVPRRPHEPHPSTSSRSAQRSRASCRSSSLWTMVTRLAGGWTLERQKAAVASAVRADAARNGRG
jgi:GTP-binding protein HflX